MKIKPFKIRLGSAEESKFIQETLFKNGYTWASLVTRPIHLDEGFLWFDGEVLRYKSSILEFRGRDISDINEISLYKFKKLYTKTINIKFGR